VVGQPLVSLWLLAACVGKGDVVGDPTDSVAGVDSGAESGVTDSTPSDDTATTPTEPSPWPEMDPMRLAHRISLDLRGVRPDDADLAKVRADAGALDRLVDEWLADDRWERRLVDLYENRFLTINESYAADADEWGVDDQAAWERSIGEEPLRVLARIGAEDLPYTELVTGDWTMADELLAATWPITYPDGKSGWQVARYADGRPAAGVLSTNGLWWRYGSTTSNANRKRANLITRVFVCDDFLDRPIEFSTNVNLSTEDAVDDALRTDPACIACHVTLDPIASYLFGFTWYAPDSPVDADAYHPEREELWASTTGNPPSWYGTPGYSLEDLGVQIASDSRFPNCAVQTGFELLLSREATNDDVTTLLEHREAFLAGGLTLRSLYRSLVQDPAYRAGATDDPRAVPVKLMGPELLASQVEELTGFRWTTDGVDVLYSDEIGVRTLAGGADGVSVQAPATQPSATSVLVLQRVALLAGRYAVDTERRVDAESRRLFREVDFTETTAADRAAMEAQVAALYLRVHGREVATDDADVELLLDLWSDLYDVHGDVYTSWSAVLIVLLSDPDFLLY